MSYTHSFLYYLNFIDRLHASRHTLCVFRRSAGEHIDQTKADKVVKFALKSNEKLNTHSGLLNGRIV